jgi:His-Xaa-Ser system protein HxsD
MTQVPLEISLPLQFASADAIERALYRVADRCTWKLSRDNDSWAVSLLVTASADPTELETDFRRHVIDYGLREKIRAETEQVRALLLAHAFSEASTKNA